MSRLGWANWITVVLMVVIGFAIIGIGGADSLASRRKSLTGSPVFKENCHDERYRKTLAEGLSYLEKQLAALG